MDSRGSIFLRIAAAVLLIGVLAVGGWMVFRAGQAQGYAMGASQVAAQVDDGQPVTPVYPGYYDDFRPQFFFPAFPLSGLLWFLFLFFVISGLFRMILWGRFGPRPYPGGWRGGPWYHYHHHYPWWSEPPAEGESAEKKPEQQ